MSHYNSAVCTDEELLEELRKLGYDDEVPPDVFDRMKEDLAELVDKEQNSVFDSEYDDYLKPSTDFATDVSPKRHTVQKTENSSNSSISRKTKKKSQRGNNNVSPDKDYKFLSSGTTQFQDTVRTGKIKSISNESFGQIKTQSDYEYPADYDSLPYEYRDTKLQNSRDGNKNVYTKYRIDSNLLSKEKKYQTGYSFENERLTQDQDISKIKPKTKLSKDNKVPGNFGKSSKTYSFHSAENSLNNNSAINIKDDAEARKFNKDITENNDPIDSYSSADYNLNSSESLKSNKFKIMKRKVHRRRNGHSIITEEILEVPIIFGSSYPQSENFTNGKSFSSDDLSTKSNSSTGSTTVLSPESSMKSCPSTLSLVSTRSSSLRVVNSRKKKNDPVAMYSYYKKFWDNFKPPGENTHNRLRWSVRDRMLEYNL